MRQSLSSTSAVLILSGLTLCMWVLVAIEATITQISALTLVMAISFTVMLALWPFLTGVRVTANGPQQLVACRECRQFMPPSFNFGFCMHCGAVARKLTPVPK